MAELGVDRAGSKQLHAIIETGDHHGGMCFGDGIQFTTGCTFGKGNIEKSGEG
jgi:formylmethanofuran dehydrogenase subunit E